MTDEERIDVLEEMASPDLGPLTICWQADSDGALVPGTLHLRRDGVPIGRCADNIRDAIDAAWYGDAMTDEEWSHYRSPRS